MENNLVVVNNDGEITDNEEIQVIPSKFSPSILESLVNGSIDLDSKKATIAITGAYYEFSKKDEKVRGVFAGYKTIQKKDDKGELVTLKCVEWVNNGQFFMNAGVVLVTECEKFGVAIGQPIEIEYAGKKGNTKLFTIRLLA